MRRLGITLLALLCGRAALAETLSMEEAVAIALYRNHDAIAARLEIESAQYDIVQAGLYPNPVLSYSFGNLVLGAGNPQGDQHLTPGFGDQTVHQVTVSEIVDIWAKRTARLRAASRSVEHRKLLVADALRDIVFAVRTAFADVLREQAELALQRETRSRYDETVRLSRARFAAGDISDAELKKVELEGLRYRNAELDAEMELDLVKEKLAALLSLSGMEKLPPLEAEALPDEKRQPFVVSKLIDLAFTERPDVKAARAARLLTDAALAQARREALPDISVGVFYTHSNFTASGDNPNALGFSLSLPLPIFDRNQGNIGKARVDVKKAENDSLRLAVNVQHEVAEAATRALRADKLLDSFEGGMLERAETALRVAEKSYRAGAVSLLELLEAQRTYLETRAQFLKALHDYRQAVIEVMHVTGDRRRGE